MIYREYILDDVEYETSVDTVLAANDCVYVWLHKTDMYIDGIIRFDDDSIRANLANVSICYD